MGDKDILPKRVGGTRWIPHTKKALESLFRGFAVYSSHLENESHTNSKADGLARLITSFNVIVFALILQVKNLNLPLKSCQAIKIIFKFLVHFTKKKLEIITVNWVVFYFRAYWSPSPAFLWHYKPRTSHWVISTQWYNRQLKFWMRERPGKDKFFV